MMLALAVMPPRPVSPTLQVAAYVSSAVNSAVYGWAATPIGAAAADRRVLVSVVSAANAPAVSSVTIGGIAATKLAEASPVSIWGASVPTGTTATVTVNYPVAAERCGVRVYAAYGLESLVPVGSLALLEDGVTSVLGPLNVSDRGIALVAALCTTAGDELTLSARFTEDLDADLEAAVRVGFATLVEAPTDTIDVTASTAGAAGDWRVAAVSLR